MTRELNLTSGLPAWTGTSIVSFTRATAFLTTKQFNYLRLALSGLALTFGFSRPYVLKLLQCFGAKCRVAKSRAVDWEGTTCLRTVERKGTKSGIAQVVEVIFILDVFGLCGFSCVP
jgi:hypothetical protein